MSKAPLPLVLALLFLSASLAGCATAYAVNVGSPAGPFRVEYRAANESLVITSAGDGTIPDVHGELRDVRLVRIHQGPIGEPAAGYLILYTSPDYRHVVAIRDGGTGQVTYGWYPDRVSWLFGASEWFGSAFRSDRPSEANAPDGSKILVPDAQWRGREVTITPPFSFGAGLSFLTDSTILPFTFGPGDTFPRRAGPWALESVEAATDDETTVRGRALPPLPQPEPQPYRTPAEASPAYHPFPLSEAIELVAPAPNEWLARAANSADRFELAADLEVANYTWSLEFDSAEEAPRSAIAYKSWIGNEATVRKGWEPTDEATNSPDRGAANTTRNTTLAIDLAFAYAQNLTGGGEASIAVVTAGSLNGGAISITYLYRFPPWLPGGTVVAIDGTGGGLVSLAGEASIVDGMVFES